MNIERPDTSGEYWQTKEGLRLQEFIAELYLSKYDPSFPLSFPKASDLLGFTYSNTGRGIIKRYIESGLLICTTTRLPRPTIVLLQKFKLHALSDSYGTVHAAALRDLTGSGLEKYLGELNPDFAAKVTHISLEDPDDPWFINWVELKKPRAHIL